MSEPGSGNLKKVKDRFSEYEDMEFEKRGEWVLAEDFSGTQLFGWEISDWVELAGGDELIYAYYDEDMNAEFVHIRGGVCLRAYTQYDGEVDTDEERIRKPLSRGGPMWQITWMNI